MIKKKPLTAAILLATFIQGIYAIQFEDSIEGWKATNAPNTVEITQEPVELKGMIKFSAPKWRGPQSDWPAFENRKYPRDWSEFDRLAIPYYGDSDFGKHLFGVYISDSKRKLQKGVFWEFRLEHPQAKMIVLPIGKAFADKNIDTQDISVIHFFTENPPTDHRVYIGQPHFLKPGDALPELSPILEEYAKVQKAEKSSFELANKYWKATRSPNTVEVAQSPSELKGMIKFSAPKWRGPQSDWPAFENRKYPRDWSEFDRLAIPYYGDSDFGKHLFGVYISDSKRRLQKGAYFDFRLDHPQARMIVIPLSKEFAKKNIDTKDIEVIHFFTENPPADHRVYIGHPYFLKPGDKVPELPEALIKYAHAQKTDKLSCIYQKMEDQLKKLDLKSFSKEQASFLKNNKQQFLEKMRAGDFDRTLLIEDDNIMEFRTLIALFDVFKNQPTGKVTKEEIQLGYAPPTWKVLPKVPVFLPLPKNLSMEAARNENESLQLVLMPLLKDCNNVEIRLSEFSGKSGKLAKSNVSVTPVGFVITKFIPNNGSRYLGAWPDPLLSFLDKVDVQSGEAQPFWIKAMIPSEQAAGEYCGNASVFVDGENIYNIPLTIKVRDFSLPNKSMLPLAVTFGPEVITDSKKNSFTSNLWKKHMDDWHKMLTGYYLNFDHLYWSTPPMEYFKYYEQMKKDGTLGYFNLGNFRPASDKPENQYGLQEIIDRIRPGYEEAKKRGLLPYAYIYGADEVQKASFPSLERAATILKKEFPGIPIFTTASDPTYGTDGSVPAIDWHCPLTRNYDMDTANKARAEGKKVWWYISNASLPPDANNFVESRGIEIRLLMGAMAQKYNVDGFLYYYISLWNREEPITVGPYTGLDARSYPGSNGDGNWCYPGPDNTPLATIRLENFRDGLEDYAYIKILEKCLSDVADTAQNKEWRDNALKALQIPTGLVKDSSVYTDDFEKLQQWRSKLAELIESAPMQRTIINTMKGQSKMKENFIVQGGSGYNSWPIVQVIGDKVVCAYSRGLIHTIEEPMRGTYARVSNDNGKTWSDESLVANSLEWGEVPIGKGFDSQGAMLLWVRCWGENKRHELYRTTDGVKFEKIASVKLNPHPMQITDIIAVPNVGLMALWFTGNYAQGGLNSWGTLTSSDNGKTWTQNIIESNLPRAQWPTEPSAIYLGDGKILAITRTECPAGDGNTAQFQLESEDYGKTWKRSKTNIRDVAFSTPCLVFDKDKGLVSNYYYQRGEGQLKRRVAKIDQVWGNPDNWPESEVITSGSTSFWDAGNVNVAVKRDKHMVAFYSGNTVDTSVLVTEVDAP